MIEYNRTVFSPPAAMALVTVSHETEGVLGAGIPMLIDTGADLTLGRAELRFSLRRELEMTPWSRWRRSTEREARLKPLLWI